MTGRTTLIVAAVIIACLVAAFVLFPPDDSSRPPPATGGSGTIFRNEPPAARLDQEAVDAAGREIQEVFRRCGAEYITEFSESVPIGPNTATFRTRHERYLDVRLTAAPQQLTEYDGLNRIDWNGAVLLSARAWASTEDGAPGDWRALEGRSLGVTRRAGQWEVTSAWLDRLRTEKRARPARCGTTGPRSRPRNR